MNSRRRTNSSPNSSSNTTPSSRLSTPTRALERDNPRPTGIQLPFVLIQASQDAEVDVEISDDQRKVHFDFNQTPFQIHDGFHVLTKMINLRAAHSSADERPRRDGGDGGGDGDGGADADADETTQIAGEVPDADKISREREEGEEMKMQTASARSIATIPSPTKRRELAATLTGERASDAECACSVHSSVDLNTKRAAFHFNRLRASKVNSPAANLTSSLTAPRVRVDHLTTCR